MTYSLDMRKRVVKFVKSGGSKTEAARVFSINPDTVYEWLKREDLRPKAHGPRTRKIDKQELIQHIEEHPEAFLRERAEHFGVHVNAIWVAMRNLGYRKKKNGDI